MKRGTNTTIINWTAEMQTLLQERFPSDCHLATSIQVFFLDYFKNNFIEKYGAEEYEKQLARASRTMVQIKNDNHKEEQEKIAKQEGKLKSRKQKLEQTEPEDPERRAEEMQKEDEKFLKENDAERERELEKIREKQLRDAKKERTAEQLENLKEALSEG